jgi:uncharacterized protein YodC (DUF2158 family)
MSQEEQFAVGETVSLNSGGHLMTVLSIDEESVTCVWSVRGDIKTKSFPARVLKKAKEERTLEEMLKELWSNSERSERLLWLEPNVVEGLRAMCGPGESFSDVILRLWAGAEGRIVPPGG